MRTLLIIALLLGAYTGADLVERHTEARLAVAESLREACVPAAGATTIITRDAATIRCQTYTSTSLQPGMARQLLSSAAVDIATATPY